jgi:hypothetical protein
VVTSALTMALPAIVAGLALEVAPIDGGQQ